MLVQIIEIVKSFFGGGGKVEIKGRSQRFNEDLEEVLNDDRIEEFEKDQKI